MGPDGLWFETFERSDGPSYVKLQDQQMELVEFKGHLEINLMGI